MGKGGTKFEGEAIGVRSGRAQSGVSAKQMRKDMEHFQKTGQQTSSCLQEETPAFEVLPALFHGSSWSKVHPHTCTQHHGI